MSKNRKPRVTKSRLQAAKKYCEISEMCVSIIKNIETDDVISEAVRDASKEISLGLEYLQDLIEWEIDKLESRKNDS